NCTQPAGVGSNASRPLSGSSSTLMLPTSMLLNALLVFPGVIFEALHSECLESFTYLDACLGL
ncbi:MAG: hypothetical protein LM590_03840, partial [Thermofilum sp.]|nr:hypothetical protein [Thermofilum sp.]